MSRPIKFEHDRPEIWNADAETICLLGQISILDTKLQNPMYTEELRELIEFDRARIIEEIEGR